MKANGWITRCKARACIDGKMAESTKASTMRIRNMDSEYTNGRMGECMRALGVKENSMGRVNTLIQGAKSD